jgi:DNA-directed RNA polymerase sigma subunit (sigma70/sigma32)
MSLLGGYVEEWYTRPEDVISKADLTYRERYIVVRYLGLEGHSVYTLKELSIVNGVTTNRIKIVLHEAFEKLRVAYKEMRNDE